MMFSSCRAPTLPSDRRDERIQSGTFFSGSRNISDASLRGHETSDHAGAYSNTTSGPDLKHSSSSEFALMRLLCDTRKYKEWVPILAVGAILQGGLTTSCSHYLDYTF